VLLFSLEIYSRTDKNISRYTWRKPVNVDQHFHCVRARERRIERKPCPFVANTNASNKQKHARNIFKEFISSISANAEKQNM